MLFRSEVVLRGKSRGEFRQILEVVSERHPHVLCLVQVADVDILEALKISYRLGNDRHLKKSLTIGAMVVFQPLGSENVPRPIAALVPVLDDKRCSPRNDVLLDKVFQACKRFFGLKLGRIEARDCFEVWGVGNKSINIQIRGKVCHLCFLS